jgi:uncharacterized phage protein (TIGR02220 family)
MLDKPNGNWIKLSRELFFHEIANDKPWNRTILWVYLIAMASTGKRTVQFRGHDYFLTRGQAAISLGDLEERTGWSKQRVRSFFDYLERKQMAETMGDSFCTILTILNYDKWQGNNCQGDIGQKNNIASNIVNNIASNIANSSPEQSEVSTNNIASNIADNTANNIQNKKYEEVLQEVSTRIKEKDTDKDIAVARKKKKVELTPEESEVLAYLNLKADNSFTASGEIGKRLAEGHTVEECKTIIDKKVAEWLGTTFDKNLNPTTLFRLCHFDTYLHQKGEVPMKKFNPNEIGKSNVGEW